MKKLRAQHVYRVQVGEASLTRIKYQPPRSSCAKDNFCSSIIWSDTYQSKPESNSNTYMYHVIHIHMNEVILSTNSQDF